MTAPPNTPRPASAPVHAPARRPAYLARSDTGSASALLSVSPSKDEFQHAGRVAKALDRAVAALLARQDADGHWESGLDNEVGVDASHLLAHTVLGLPQPPQGPAIRAWIRAQQGGEGAWPSFAGGPDDPSATVMAYLALRAGGEDPAAPHMRIAARRIRAWGGLRACRPSTRLWAVLLGVRPWSDVKALPPEAVLLGSGPVALDDFADWARPVVVALSVITALRPVRRNAPDLSEIFGDAPRARPWHTFAATRAYTALVPGEARARALKRARAWLLERQADDGCWNGTHPATVHAAIALRLLDGPGDREAVRRAVAGLGSFVRPRGDKYSRVQFSRAPVRDTAGTVLALRAAGVADGHPAMRSARAWLLGAQAEAPGDWAVHRPALAPGGWSARGTGRTGPGTGETALVLRALGAVPSADDRDRVRRGRRWLAGMAWRGGGWSGFDADARVARVLRLPLHDGRAVTDPPTADATASAVESLAGAGPEYEAAVRDGVRWLLDHQEPDGSWPGQWGCNHLYGTTRALHALVAAGVPHGDARVRKAVAWLYSRQNGDGGWGEDRRSYRYAAWRGRGRSTASQTGWVLHALIAAGERGPRVAIGVDWLLRHQQPGGLWYETAYTGTGFPRDVPVRYGSDPHVFPVLALAAYGRASGARPSPSRQALDGVIERG
ncbi:squalene--hopene cyclase [Actinomadura fibrosa]|uniref:Squalene--hopene cyclase n=1 Tax=Actinomadura fibrosa TaxID=111802 RepID=A0ABW2XIV0_9ACTN